MAKKCLIIKQRKTPKYLTRRYSRCRICGRPRGFLRDFGLCRICFRNFAHKGLIPGVTKSSW
ncbi:MAG: type Z 30S ribosomal protein S14 [Elusimicrobia bacterium]|nr:type Z 30S ribosomal protein S14 [Elusimicrobiota bacterium]